MSFFARFFFQTQTSEDFSTESVSTTQTLQVPHETIWRRRSVTPSLTYSDSEVDTPDTSFDTENQSDVDEGWPAQSARFRPKKGKVNAVNRPAIMQRDSVTSLEASLAEVSISGWARSVTDAGASYRRTTPLPKANNNRRSPRLSRTNRQIQNLKDLAEKDEALELTVFNRTNSTASCKSDCSGSTISDTDDDSDSDRETLYSPPERTPSPSPPRRARGDRVNKVHESPLSKRFHAAISPKNRRRSSAVIHAEDGEITINTIQNGSVSGSVDVRVDDWIPRYVRPSARQKLIEIMMKEYPNDEPGFLYCLEMFPKMRADLLGYSIIKVGRSKNIDCRVKQWSGCSEDLPKLLGIFPKPRQVKRGGKVKPDITTKLHKRLEAFVLTELRDIALHSSHLEDDFDPEEPSPCLKRVKLREATAVEQGQHARHPCPHCYKVHDEIFFFAPSDNTNAKLQVTEWDAIVQPVITRWARFIEEVILQD
ncbi:hypothetical protein FRC03_000065 [Tulasnella sp. 419]|nr:hypothetical protein FRC03_000065 [Tulasnella sp. 419]